jgi:cytosine/adenosine deaminase-related metal-dependent hydrolase
MRLNNVHILNDREPASISIRDEKIEAISSAGGKAHALQINFENAIALPGLINSHDHLDFNCFVPLGERKYNNYTEWGRDIHKNYADEIESVLAVPRELRTLWGMYKNLLAGVTTVVNHGEVLSVSRPLINILQDSQSLHSVSFQKHWKWKLNNPFLKNKLCVIHAGEGVDEQSATEINELLNYNLLNRKLVGVHGVAMAPGQAKKFAGLIWCPVSNMVLFDKHADVEQLKDSTTLVFGTDSTLTAGWDTWKHLRLGRSLKKLSDTELFASVTTSPAKLWNTNGGSLQAGKDADIIVVNRKSEDNWEGVFSTTPADVLLVVHRGRVRLLDESVSSFPLSANFSSIGIDGKRKFIEGDLPGLIEKIHQYNPDIRFPVNARFLSKK